MDRIINSEQFFKMSQTSEVFSKWILAAQEHICQEVEKADAREKFQEDRWTRDGGGGGITKVIQNGNVFEKGGVNTSGVYGKITPQLREQLRVDGTDFFACGISLVLHPFSPMVATVHANFRYFEVYDSSQKLVDCWFGGGADLTPYYLNKQDAVHFHQCLKDSCDKFDKAWYREFKRQCDDYFSNHHRNEERRGIGGIFYDHLRPSGDLTSEKIFEFAQSNAEAFIQGYMPIVERSKHLSFTDGQKDWQLFRRGRYVEFNLIHDRGTIFGLKSNGRTESILMSLPMNVRFPYNYQPEPGSEEEKLQRVLMKPVDWI